MKSQTGDQISRDHFPGEAALKTARELNERFLYILYDPDYHPQLHMEPHRQLTRSPTLFPPSCLSGATEISTIGLVPGHAEVGDIICQLWNYQRLCSATTHDPAEVSKVITIILVGPGLSLQVVMVQAGTSSVIKTVSCTRTVETNWLTSKSILQL